ncbi:MAG: hypothetical protein JSW41_04780 [Candidatus Aenigmatarchaeota archaeon]|nr:MAG: hypothetical protein JSW41_04780 [Candidatus Aenigmarchaeota archaeon]
MAMGIMFAFVGITILQTSMVIDVGFTNPIRAFMPFMGDLLGPDQFSGAIGSQNLSNIIFTALLVMVFILILIGLPVIIAFQVFFKAPLLEFYMVFCVMFIITFILAYLVGSAFVMLSVVA